MATCTCGLTRNLPRLSAPAICEPASEADRPATFTSPMSGTEIVPRSLMRVSSVRSGCWKTVTRTASPIPSFSLACAPSRPATVHSNSATKTCLISPRSGFLGSLLQVCHVLNARVATQPAHFGRGELHALAPRQELLDHRRGLLLRKGRRFGLHQLHYRSAHGRGEHRDLAFLHARELRQLRQRQLLRGLREADGREARIAPAQPGGHLLQILGARRLRAQHFQD